MEINHELKDNLIADVENILELELSDEQKISLGRCFEITIGSMSNHKVPEPPAFPLNRVMREGVLETCNHCGSTMSKTGFMGIMGERRCDNKKCPTHK